MRSSNIREICFLYRTMLSLVSWTVFVAAVVFLLISPPMTSIEKPITKTKEKRIEEDIKELKIIIKSNNDKLFSKKMAKERLEKTITSYIAKDVFWHNGKKKKLPKEYCKRVAKLIVKHTKYPIVTTSIIYAESAFDKNAVNPESGALGLGQITITHKEELIKAGIINSSFSELKETEKNIMAIDFVLRNKMKITSGNMDKALCLYSGNAHRYSEKIWKKVTDIRNHLNSGT